MLSRLFEGFLFVHVSLVGVCIVVLLLLLCLTYFHLNGVYYHWLWTIHRFLFGGIPKVYSGCVGGICTCRLCPSLPRFSTMGKRCLVVVAVQGAPPLKIPLSTSTLDMILENTLSLRTSWPPPFHCPSLQRPLPLSHLPPPNRIHPRSDYYCFYLNSL